MSKLIIGGHGIGDCILAIQCAFLTYDTRWPLPEGDFEIQLATRDEVYRPLSYFFGTNCYLHDNMSQISEELGEENFILSDKCSYLEEMAEKYEEVYYVIPDLLFRNPHSFPFMKYNLSPHVIKTQRFAMNFWKPKNKIYIGLVTMAEHHRYGAIKPLIYALAKALPAYEIYFPNVKKWGGADLDWGDFNNKPDNVFIHENPSFEDSIDHLKESCFGIFADNGPSHLAYQLGMPRIVLDNFIKRNFGIKLDETKLTSMEEKRPNALEVAKKAYEARESPT